MQAGWQWPAALILLVGPLVVVWAILFSFLEVGRIASWSDAITGLAELWIPMRCAG